MSKIEEKREYVKEKLAKGHIRPRIAEMMAEEFGISEGYAYTFIYTHFSGEEYRTPREKRKKPDFNKNKKGSNPEKSLEELAQEMGFQ